MQKKASERLHSGAFFHKIKPFLVILGSPSWCGIMLLLCVANRSESMSRNEVQAAGAAGVFTGRLCCYPVGVKCAL